jgi:hypothetical protein
MSTGEQTQGAPDGALALSPEELAAVEKGRAGFGATEVNPLIKPAEGPQRPEGVPEKFWDAEKGTVNTEALIKSYTELERARTQQPQEQSAPGAEENTPAPVAENGKITKPAEPEAPAASPLTDVIAAAQQEYASAKEVSEDTVKKLEEAGIPREIFQLYLKGVEATEKATVAVVHQIVGGEDAYNEMARWAANNLSDAELDAFNTALDNEALRENAVRGLYSRFSEARPNEGKLVAPNGNSNADAGDVYTSRDQLIADQRDERYTRGDAAFHQYVQDKLMRSQTNGFQLGARPLFERQVYSS